MLLLCGAAGADSTSTDSVSATAGGAPASAPAPTTEAAPLALHPPAAGLFRADRVVHASLALALGTGIGLASREPATGAASVLALAVAKELLDERLDRGDLAAGALGAGLAWLIVATLKP